MKFLNKTLILVTCLIGLYSYSQEKAIDIDINPSYFNSIIEKLPKISKDSTSVEITAHVQAMLEWMTEEHYKSSFVPILIYADKGLSLAKKSENQNHIHDIRSVIGNTLIRIKDTVSAKKLFLKSLAEAEKNKDSSLLLRSKGNLANIYYYTKGYKGRTIKAYLENIEIALKLKDTTRLFILHHNLCRAFNETQKPERSAYHIEKTEHYLNLLGNPPHYQASHFHNIGRMHLLLNQPNEAIENFQKTINLCKNTEFTDALLEGYIGFKEALAMKKDYKGVYEVANILETYEEEKDKTEAKSIIESVSAKLNVERFKDQIKSEELEKKLLVQEAERKNILLILVVGIGLFLGVILCVTYYANKRRKVLVNDLQAKNKQYLLAKQESDELTKAKAKFFATVSHELRTPLYGVIGLSSILLETNELKKHETDLKSLKFSANYLLALINDLLHINKIENNSFSDEETTFNIIELINTIVSSFEYIRLQHQNKIKINVDKKVPNLLKGNSVRLSQILMNLIGNACKFTEKGVIELNILTLENLDNKVKLQFLVKDTGPGIEQNKISQIFNEFTQIDSSSSNYQGTGLGLPIVKKLVEQANGTISVDSELGKGTMFKFTLEISIASESEQLTKTPILDFKQLAEKRILIVEDNRINQTVTKRILENSDVICDIAQNGEEAITLVKNKEFDLILMDINMPVKNGIDATKEIRTFNKFIPIIALTAVEIEEQKYQIFDCGMNDVILKPYDIDQFKKTIIANISPKEIDGLKKMA
ncbi:response regulator [Winogradskyella sp. PE311]|uniref:response regulator n=1 Tax=Winogradskyella sp. PE311 TaxID=3366943 RepID=UPI003980A577